MLSQNARKLLRYRLQTRFYTLFFPVLYAAPPPLRRHSYPFLWDLPFTIHMHFLAGVVMKKSWFERGALRSQAKNRIIFPTLVIELAKSFKWAPGREGGGGGFKRKYAARFSSRAERKLTRDRGALAYSHFSRDAIKGFRCASPHTMCIRCLHECSWRARHLKGHSSQSAVCI